MKIDIRFDSEEEAKVFLMLLSRIFKNVEYESRDWRHRKYYLYVTDPVKAGRPKVEIDSHQTSQIIDLYQQGRSINSISRELNISRRQIYKVIDQDLKKENINGDHIRRE